MVQIPQYTQQVGLAAPSRDVPPIDDSIGRGLSSLGSALSNVAEAIARRKQQKAEFGASVGFDGYRERMTQKLVEAERNAPADGSGLHDDFMLNVRSKEAQSFLATITDPDLREKYATILNTSDAEHWSNAAANSEWKLGNDFTVNKTNEMWNRRGQAIASDPSSVQAYVDEMLSAIDKAPNLTPSQREDMKQKFREAGPKIAVEALKVQDPEALYFASGNGTHEQRIAFLSKRLNTAVASVENAPADPGAVSSRGAVGLMQVTPEAAEDVAKKIGDKGFLALSPEERITFLKNGDNNKLYGSTYLGMMVDRYKGDVEAALVAYNAGAGNADKWLAAGRDYAALPKPGETQPYVQKVFAAMGAAKLVSGAVEEGPTAHLDTPFWSSRYAGKRAIHTEMVPEFASRLQKAITDAETATGSKARITSLTRTNAEQRKAYRDYLLTGGLAAVPAGMKRKDGTISQGSRHERGMAADIAPGPVLDWLHQHADEYGLEFLKGPAFAKDPVHIQMKLDGKSTPADVTIADARGAAPDGVPGSAAPNARSGFVSPAFAGLPVNDLLEAQRTGSSSYAKAAQTQLAQDTADSILASAGATASNPGDSRAAYSALDAIKDADVRKDVATLIDSHFTRWDHVQKDQRTEDYRTAYSSVDTMVAAGDVKGAVKLVKTSNLPPEDQDRLMTRIAKGPVAYDDPAAERDLTALLLRDPAKFASVDLVKDYGNSFTTDTLAKFGEKQATLRKTDDSAARSLIETAKTANPIIENNLAAIGIRTDAKATPEDNAHANLVRAMTQKEIEKLQEKLGRPPLISEINDAVSSVMKTYPRFKPVESSWFPWRSADSDVSMPEVLKSYDDAKLDINQAAEALRRAGKPVNPATLQQTLDDYQAVQQ